MKISRVKIWIWIGMLTAFSMACSLFTGFTIPSTESKPVTSESEPESQDQPAKNNNGPTPTPPADIYPAAFAEFPQISVNIPEKYAGEGSYTLPVNLNRVTGLEEIPFTPEQTDLLASNGFIVVPGQAGDYQEFYQIYESSRYDSAVVFVTTDSIYHTYHLLFDKMLRDLETQHFIGQVNALTTSMIKASQDQVNTLKGTSLEEAAKRNLAFFVVAGQLLKTGDAIPAEVKDLVDSELSLIDAHKEQVVSPIWDQPDLAPADKLIEDYTQYIPRGHYTRTEALKNYFKGMMWYGRLTYRLNNALETRRALLLVQALRSAKAEDGTSAITLWGNIYDPTVFIVGKSDDLSFTEYGVLSDSVFGAVPDLMAFADEGLFAKFMEGAKNLPPPRVNSMWVWITQDKEQVTKGFRFMGQRFTLDQYVFGQVIWRNVGTLENQRGLPKGLDLLAAMGSNESYDILKEMGETKYENYDKQLTKVKGEVASLDKETWTQNLYWSWLYSFFPLIEPKDESFPVFMQTQAWTRKDLAAALGSWTELKHDTILYAKQVMAEMGGGGPDVEPPHGWVEPNPEAFARLKALAQMTISGLEARNLTTEWSKNTFENLIEELTFLQTVSEKELAGEKLTTDEYWHIFYFGGVLEQFAIASVDVDGEGRVDMSDVKAALVADVATGTAADIGGLAALEEAVGQPMPIFVVLPDDPWRIGIGAVFSYYEFPVPTSERMNDKQWQDKVETGQTPPMPNWTESYIKP